jgi:Phospholipase B
VAERSTTRKPVIAGSGGESRPSGIARFSHLLLVSGLVSAQIVAPALAGSARASSRPPLALAVSALQERDSLYETAEGKGYRFERGGWTYVHLEGAPHEVGYQHGYLLAPEIADAFAAARLEMTHKTERNWDFFRRAARQMLWPRLDPEYQAEIQGIADGLAARNTKLDVDDIVALNAFQELADYYVPWLNERVHAATAPRIESLGHCSAFVANGSWTKDHQIVMAHSNWTSYMTGVHWRIIFDIVPQTGNRMLMDGYPGVIASDDDFGVNSAGMMITETTISNFHGWNTLGKAEFMRARKAMQYANSIDQFAKIMLEGNNGGYANDWLLGDRKTGEIARFELGLQHSKVWRTNDGYFSGANFPSDPEVTKDETDFNPDDAANSANARRARWDQLLGANRGKIDAGLAEIFLADHFDSYTKAEGADQRTLCGHNDAAPDGSVPYEPFGAVSGQVMDGRMAQALDFSARVGHLCGVPFDAAKFLTDHPEFSWQAAVLRDMVAGPWNEFRIGEHAPEQRDQP